MGLVSQDRYALTAFLFASASEEKGVGGVEREGVLRELGHLSQCLISRACSGVQSIPGLFCSQPAAESGGHSLKNK